MKLDTGNDAQNLADTQEARSRFRLREDRHY